MKFIDLDMKTDQIEYHKFFKKQKSAGDPGVCSNPQPISIDKIKNKDKEWNEYKDAFLQSLNSDEIRKYNKMINIVKRIRKIGFSENPQKILT